MIPYALDVHTYTKHRSHPNSNEEIQKNLFTLVSFIQFCSVYFTIVLFCLVISDNNMNFLHIHLSSSGDEVLIILNTLFFLSSSLFPLSFIGSRRVREVAQEGGDECLQFI